MEASDELSKSINFHRYGREWEFFPRTAFESISRKINHQVTKRVIDDPELVTEHLIIGEDELESVFFRYGLKSWGDFIQFLESNNGLKPFNWISGKTLQSYWNGGNPKDKKYNVLLTYLNIPRDLWEEWKQPTPDTPILPFDRSNTSLLKRHYLGAYYRYYQRSDESRVLVKTPLIIREDAKGDVIVETKTMGHRYRSTYVAIRDGALYIDCENIDWNEKENHIYNIGFETDPDIVVGVSNTLNRRKQAIAVRNVLVKQRDPYDYSKTDVVEIPYETVFKESCDDQRMVEFFSKSSCNILQTAYIYSLPELNSSLD